MSKLVCFENLNKLHLLISPGRKIIKKRDGERVKKNFSFKSIKIQKCGIESIFVTRPEGSSNIRWVIQQSRSRSLRQESSKCIVTFVPATYRAVSKKNIRPRHPKTPSSAPPPSPPPPLLLFSTFFFFLKWNFFSIVENKTRRKSIYTTCFYYYW